MANKIIGTEDSDQLIGTTDNEVFKGLDGDDVIFGGGGADRLVGGKGNDGLDGADADMAADTMLGGGGDDRINGGYGDRLDGGAGQDFFGLYLQNMGVDFKLDLTGLTKGGTLKLKNDGGVVTGMESGEIYLGNGTDKVTVGDAHVAVFGGGNNDTLIGGNGSDTLGGGWGNDIVNGGKGSDWVSYQDVSGAVHVDLGIQGEAQDTGAFGGSDTLTSIENVQGSAYDDVLIGNSGANKFDSYSGVDTLTGGGGADTFVFTYAGQSPNVSPVVITDLSNDDTIDLHGIDADSGQDGDQDFTFVAQFTGHAGEARMFLDTGGNTRVQLDTNGDGAADDCIIMQGDHTDFENFVL